MKKIILDGLKTEFGSVEVIQTNQNSSLLQVNEDKIFVENNLTKKEAISLIKKFKKRMSKIKKTLNELFNVVIFDTETTGLNNHIIYVDGKPISIDLTMDTPEIIELAFMAFDKKGNFSFFENTCTPKNALMQPMPASITGYDARTLGSDSQKYFNEIESTKEFKKRIKKNPFVVAHNMPFDEQLVRLHNIEMTRDTLIDTVRVSKHLFNRKGLQNLEGTVYNRFTGEAPENHKLQYFRSLYEMDHMEYFIEGMKMCNLKEIKPHTALSDVFVLWIFVAMLMADFDITLEEMVELTNTPVLEDKYLYGPKNKTINKTYDQVIYTESLNNWGKLQPGYDALMWGFEEGPMSVDTEYSIIYHMGKAILNGTVPFIKTKKHDYTQFLYLSIKYCFNEEEIERALTIMNKEKSFIPLMIKNSKIKIEESMKETLPDNIDKLKVSKFLSKRDNRIFLHNYTEMFRMDILNKFQ